MAIPRKLAASFSKLERARTLAKEFEAICADYEAGSSLIVVPEADDTGLMHIKLKTPDRIPDTASHLAAEVVYHTRSALDHMVAEIARQNGVNDTSHLHFPIVRKRDQFSEKGNLRKMRGLPEDVQELLRKLEPFEDGNERLWGLGAFANVDKHNMLIPIGGIGGLTSVHGLKVDGNGHPEAMGLAIGAFGNLYEGVTISKIGPGGFFHAERIEAIRKVFFGEIPAFPNSLAVPTLNDLIKLGEGIVHTFSAHCFGQ